MAKKKVIIDFKIKPLEFDVEFSPNELFVKNGKTKTKKTKRKNK